jgi:hypothetical protein
MLLNAIYAGILYRTKFGRSLAEVWPKFGRSLAEVWLQLAEQSAHDPKAEGSNPASTARGNVWHHIFFKMCVFVV